ncbi:isochorismatase family protein [Acidiphilium sp. AL]|uniref:Isochorismatase family protein n=1 Tax=Acidiphilium iwatense TaxID=768198 RepID=A0ABS9E1I7_9PROT|nr:MULTISPECIES: isochorismatase family protein [Acidiphilium]MCF3948870.1 isochorismatase family protein [Acidiphilium iwatense]MCU4162232.1 isochorismatase family protein [Acidiphilium sp. AL]
MSASNSALVVIDAQESFRHCPDYREQDVSAFVAHLQRLVDGAKTAGIPIVQIFHVEDSGPFAETSGFVTSFTPLIVQPEVIFHKHRHSALVGTGLDVWLTMHGIRRLIVSGIRSEQCCETTVRHASDLGYAVDYVSEATLTFSMTDATGREWGAAEIRARTELVLAERFARIATVEDALAG